MLRILQKSSETFTKIQNCYETTYKIQRPVRMGKSRHNPDTTLHDRSGRESLQTLQDGAGLSKDRTN